ncbi:GlxA family transcriptional regulator [Labrys wisconsinensis]|uniref:AraC family carnitine catabolism transcriptional activator n=1 Tax=Labrys wisconsinensis TaxID=425677 RepID=A0ABU0J1U1_9HYPH|nr:GlxA family transcriptional regulator [Labrys wisconsinensis]MDQ0467413.1 AraC family carnitine catabolism transcriptional activator [Labrys wisconsinensis]
MFKPYPGPGPEPIGFLLVPQFSMMAFSAAVEPLRVANRLSGRRLFSWHTASVDGAPVASSGGMALPVERRLADLAAIPTLIVCASFEPEKGAGKPTLAALRRLARRGTTIGALDTGAWILAAAGLLEGASATMHWEAAPGFAEAFPDIAISEALFEVGGNRFTCAGGTAALDLMLDMIARKHGQSLAVAVSEQFIHDRIRDRHDRQRMSLPRRLGVVNGKLLRVVEAMEGHLETPLDARRLAGLSGVSPRQLERLFRAQLKESPSAYYLKLRLERARGLLRQTDMSVMEIAMACGYSSASCLSRSYRGHFGIAPRQDRIEPAQAPAPR